MEVFPRFTGSEEKRSVGVASGCDLNPSLFYFHLATGQKQLLSRSFWLRPREDLAAAGAVTDAVEGPTYQLRCLPLS